MAHMETTSLETAKERPSLQDFSGKQNVGADTMHSGETAEHNLMGTGRKAHAPETSNTDL